MPVPDGRVAVMYADWISHPDTGVDEIAVLTVLALHADREGVCWPSQALLARLLNRSRPWVNKVVTRLCALDLLRKTRRQRQDGGNRSCLYQLVYPSGVPSAARAPLNNAATINVAHQSGPVAEAATEQAWEATSSSDPGPVPCPDNDRGGSGFDSGGFAQDNRKIPFEPLQEDSLSAATAAAPASSISPESILVLPLAEDWQPSAADLRWAAQYFPESDLVQHTQRFISRCRAKGYSYRDPAAAWRAWLIDDSSQPAVPRFVSGRRTSVDSIPRCPRPSPAVSPVYQRWQVWGQLATQGGGDVA